MSRTVVTVNGVTWKEDSHSIEKPCNDCSKVTRGRIAKVAYCVDCGMKHVMRPLESVRDVIRGLFA